jgi:hypothetical protein
VEQVSWQQGVAEELPLQDSSQDVVISTLVSCAGGPANVHTRSHCFANDSRAQRTIPAR